MPNNTQSLITFHGKNKDICAILDFIKDDVIGAGSIDFNKILPLDEISTSYEKWGTENAYGFDSLDLNYTNLDMRDVDSDPNYCRLAAKDYFKRIGPAITFTTAWSMPESVVAELSKRFPKVGISLYWADPEGIHAAAAIFRQGERVAFSQPAAFSPDATRLEKSTLSAIRSLKSSIIDHRQPGFAKKEKNFGLGRLFAAKPPKPMQAVDRQAEPHSFEPDPEPPTPTDAEIFKTQERLTNLRALQPDEKTYDLLNWQLEDKDYTLISTAAELTGTNPDKLFINDLRWDIETDTQLLAMEHKAFAGKPHEAVETYREELWKKTVDKLQSAHRLQQLVPSELEELNKEISQRCNELTAASVELGAQGEAQNTNAAVVGRITWHDSGETIEYTDPIKFIDTIEENYSVHGISGWAIETVTPDVNVHCAVDEIRCGEFGETLDHAAYTALFEQFGANKSAWPKDVMWHGDDEEWARHELQKGDNSQNIEISIPINEKTTAKLSIKLRLEATKQTCADRTKDTPPPARHDHGPER